MTKYAIQITNDNLDLLEVLNGGMRPKVEEDTYLIFDSDPDIPNDIKHEDDLYDENGRSKVNLHWLIG